MSLPVLLPSIPPPPAVAVPAPSPSAIAGEGQPPAAVLLPTAGVAAPPAPEQTAPAAPAPLPVQPISVEAWRTLESATHKQVPNVEGTRYLAVEERVRDEVCRLLILSDYDVGTLMTNIVQSLQHVGRHDVGLLRNENSTAFTLTQSAAYARQGDTPVEQRCHAVADAIERINQSGIEAERAFVEEAHRMTVTAPPVAPVKSAPVAAPPSFRKSAYEVIMEQIAATRRRRSPQKRRTASPEGRRGRAAGGAGSLEHPVSYNGSYLLRRYGGTYDPQSQYSHYRKYGLPSPK
ncbi:hypothetical protein JKF63_06657 [Porcisia hertigi]|uniref:Uncharacterized protein n=1 Tax=Porcisia hertigi TaxID=2761500 RepID=A0A836LG42_9TRYP|nr:hypothetical protein JKF63_06657 [Porcisia hertigi]